MNAQILNLRDKVQSDEPPSIRSDSPGWKHSCLVAPSFCHVKSEKCIATWSSLLSRFCAVRDQF